MKNYNNYGRQRQYLRHIECEMDGESEEWGANAEISGQRKISERL